MAPRNATIVGTSEVLVDQSSPYFVHPSDGPSSVTISPILKGSNYYS